MKRPTCETCVHWDGENVRQSWNGEEYVPYNFPICRRLAPGRALISDGGKIADSHVGSGANDWCGEHQDFEAWEALQEPTELQKEYLKMVYEQGGTK